MKLDVDAEGLAEPGDEELHLLGFQEGSCAGEEREEMVLVVGDRAGTSACRQLSKWIRSDRWTKSHVEERGEAPPRWNAFVSLQAHVPLLC